MLDIAITRRQTVSDTKEARQAEPTWVRTSVEDEIIQNVPRLLWLVSLMVVGRITHKLMHEITLPTGLATLRPHDRGLQAEPQGHRKSLMKDFFQRITELVEVEFG